MNSLLNNYIMNSPDASRWYPCALSDVEQYAAKRGDGEGLRAEELSEWRDFLMPFAPHEKVLAHLNVLADPRARVVFTGQQAGLLGGPLYTIYKAIGAIRWARRLAEKMNVPVVPLFWVASDDHDFDEVASLKWLDFNGAVQGWTANTRGEDAARPVYARGIAPEELRALATHFESTSPPGAFRDAILQFIAQIAELKPLNWETQFTACLCRWFGAHGLVPIVPRLNFMRRRAAAVIAKEIVAAPQSTQIIIQSGERLAEAAGKGAGLHRSGNEANFFLLIDDRRSKVVVDRDCFRVHDPAGNSIRQLSRAEMAEMLQEQPQAFSPNAALRPLVQDFALPSVAYVGGPSELIYHAQIGPLYEMFEVPRPALIPRPSALLMEPAVSRTMSKLDVDVREVAAGGPDALMGAVARAADESNLRLRIDHRIGEATKSIEEMLQLIQQDTTDTGLYKAAEKMKQGVETGSAKLRERLDQFLLRRNEDLARQSQRVQHALWPEGEAQERVLSALSPLLRTAGPNAPESLVENLDECNWSTQIVELS